jgi:hypothetical protein
MSSGDRRQPPKLNTSGRRQLTLIIEDIRQHVPAWIGLLEEHVARLSEDGLLGTSDGARSYAEHELKAMKRDLTALLAAAVKGR